MLKQLLPIGPWWHHCGLVNDGSQAAGADGPQETVTNNTHTHTHTFSALQRTLHSHLKWPVCHMQKIVIIIIIYAYIIYMCTVCYVCCPAAARGVQETSDYLTVGVSTCSSYTGADAHTRAHTGPHMFSLCTRTKHTLVCPWRCALAVFKVCRELVN